MNKISAFGKQWKLHIWIQIHFFLTEISEITFKFEASTVYWTHPIIYIKSIDFDDAIRLKRKMIRIFCNFQYLNLINLPFLSIFWVIQQLFSTNFLLVWQLLQPLIHHQNLFDDVADRLIVLFWSYRYRYFWHLYRQYHSFYTYDHVGTENYSLRW